MLFSTITLVLGSRICQICSNI